MKTESPILSKIFGVKQEPILRLNSCYIPSSSCFGVSKVFLDKEKSTSQKTIVSINVRGWHSCRETFSSYFTSRTRYFSFSVPLRTNLETFSAFFRHVENKLELKPAQRSGFYKTSQTFNSCQVILVKPSTFWRESLLRRQLFTILLRCAVNYNRRNFEYALFSHPYANNTKEAVNRFLKGYTALPANTNLGYGWFSYFNPHYTLYDGRKPLKEDRVNKLIKPPKVKAKPKTLKK